MQYYKIMKRCGGGKFIISLTEMLLPNHAAFYFVLSCTGCKNTVRCTVIALNFSDISGVEHRSGDINSDEVSRQI